MLALLYLGENLQETTSTHTLLAIELISATYPTTYFILLLRFTNPISLR